MTTDQNSKLHDAIADLDSRRCVEPCPTCDGDGCTERGCCIECIGSGLAFRDDAEGLNRIEAAISKWRASDEQYLQMKATAEESYQLGQRKLWTMLRWDNRFGQPWQSAIEQHVREYVAPAPDLRTNPEELKRLLREAGYGYRLIVIPENDEPFEASIRGPVWARADTEGDALFNAACAALLGGE